MLYFQDQLISLQNTKFEARHNFCHLMKNNTFKQKSKLIIKNDVT